MPLWRYGKDFFEIKPKVFKSEGGAIIRLGSHNQTVEIIDGGDIERELVKKINKRISIESQLYH